jgi:hypothetical protein
MRRRCDVNRSFWCLASIVCLRFLAERFQQTGKGSVKVERSEPKGNLDGFLARLHDSQKNEGKSPKSKETFLSQGPSMV